MALLSSKKTEDAKKELAAMIEIMTDSTIKDLSIWGSNCVFDLCIITSKTLEGEIAAKEKIYTQAITLLNEAVQAEDALNYNEPPDWFFSIRHHLGAVLIDAGKITNAINVYNQDLINFPDNGWALTGLMNAYSTLGEGKKYEEAKNTSKRPENMQR